LEEESGYCRGYATETVDGGSFRLEYPCVMLNANVHDHFMNHQYQTLTDPARGIYETRSECSIFFEVMWTVSLHGSAVEHQSGKTVEEVICRIQL
jgi:hypothetical protein